MPPALYSPHVYSSHCDWNHLLPSALPGATESFLHYAVNSGCCWLIKSSLLLCCLVQLIEHKSSGCHGMSVLQSPEQGQQPGHRHQEDLNGTQQNQHRLGELQRCERHLWEAVSPCSCLSFQYQIQQELGASASQRSATDWCQNGQWHFASLRNRLFLFLLG